MKHVMRLVWMTTRPTTPSIRLPGLNVAVHAGETRLEDERARWSRAPLFAVGEGGVASALSDGARVS